MHYFEGFFGIIHTVTELVETMCFGVCLHFFLTYYFLAFTTLEYVEKIQTLKSFSFSYKKSNLTLLTKQI